MCMKTNKQTKKDSLEMSLIDIVFVFTMHTLNIKQNFTSFCADLTKPHVNSFEIEMFLSMQYF